MKKIKNIIIAISLVIGYVTIGWTLSLFIPVWAVIMLFSLVLIIDIARTKHHYWMINYYDSCGEMDACVVCTTTQVFTIKDSTIYTSKVKRIINVTEIDKYTYDYLLKHL